jgi:paraquat-inducible protein B
MKVGKVIEFHLEFDPASKKFRIPVTAEIEFERIRLTSGSYDQYGKGALMPEFVARGLRAQLRSASLLTGQLMIALDFFPNAPPASVVSTDTYPKLPTVPNELENITRSVSRTLDKIADLPLDDVVRDLRQILQSVQEITGSPEIKESVKSLNKAIVAIEHLTRDADTQMGPLLTSLRQASDAADSALKRASATLASATAGYGGDSRIHGDLSDLLRQLQETAKSVRVLANFLEQHPEALVRGKAGAAQ